MGRLRGPCLLPHIPDGASEALRGAGILWPPHGGALLCLHRGPGRSDQRAGRSGGCRARRGLAGVQGLSGRPAHVPWGGTRCQVGGNTPISGEAVAGGDGRRREPPEVPAQGMRLGGSPLFISENHPWCWRDTFGGWGVCLWPSPPGAPAPPERSRRACCSPGDPVAPIRAELQPISVWCPARRWWLGLGPPPKV